MACSDYPTLVEFWSNGQFVDGVACAFDGIGLPIAALFVFGSMAVGLTVYHESPLPALPVVILMGVVVVASLPGVALQGVAAVLLLALTGAGYVLWLRTERSV